jgi:hypothetical protein
VLCLAAHRHRAADTNHKMHLTAQPTENSCLVQEFMSITPIATGHAFGHVREAWLAQARIQHDYSPSDSSTCAHMTTHHQMCQIYRHEHFFYHISLKMLLIHIYMSGDRHTQSLACLSIEIILSKETSPNTGDETINERLHHRIYPYSLRDPLHKGPSYRRI